MYITYSNNIFPGRLLHHQDIFLHDSSNMNESHSESPDRGPGGPAAGAIFSRGPSSRHKIATPSDSDGRSSGWAAASVHFPMPLGLVRAASRQGHLCQGGGVALATRIAIQDNGVLTRAICAILLM